MTIATVRTNLQRALETIPGLKGRVYITVPAALRVPCAIMGLEPGMSANYLEPGNLVTWQFRVLLLVGKFNPQVGAEALDDYINKTGYKSVYARVCSYWKDNSLPDYSVVTRAENIGAIRYRDQTFFGCEFVITIGETTE